MRVGGQTLDDKTGSGGAQRGTPSAAGGLSLAPAAECADLGWLRAGAASHLLS